MSPALQAPSPHHRHRFQTRFPHGTASADAYSELFTSATLCVYDVIKTLSLRADWFIRALILRWAKAQGCSDDDARKLLSAYCHAAHGDQVDDDHSDGWVSLTYVRLAVSLEKSTRQNSFDLVAAVEREYELLPEDADTAKSLPKLVEIYEYCVRGLLNYCSSVDDTFISFLLYATDVALIKTSASGAGDERPLMQPNQLRNDLISFHTSKAETLQRHNAAHLMSILLEENFMYTSADELGPDIVSEAEAGGTARHAARQSQVPRGLVHYEPLPSAHEQVLLDTKTIFYRLYILANLEDLATNLLQLHTNVVWKNELVAMATSWWRQKLQVKHTEMVAAQVHANNAAAESARRKRARAQTRGSNNLLKLKKDILLKLKKVI